MSFVKHDFELNWFHTINLVNIEFEGKWFMLGCFYFESKFDVQHGKFFNPTQKLLFMIHIQTKVWRQNDFTVHQSNIFSFC